MARIDYDAASQTYDPGRSPTDAQLQPWRDAVRREIRQGSRGLDVGSGTGFFAVDFAESFDAVVVAVEPSEGMRNRARTHRGHRAVHNVAGRAEALPVARGSLDWAWLSTVIQHFDDLPRAAQEVRRARRARRSRPQ